MKRNFIILMALVFAILILFAGCQTLGQTNKTVILKDSLSVHYLDVGQGDAILLVDGDATMLIDGGDPGNGSNIINYIKDLGITQLDFVVASHNHNDHAGGLVEVVSTIPVDKILMTNSQETQASYDLIQAANQKSIPITTPAIGNTLTLGESNIEFLGPTTTHDEPNDDSLVMKVTHGKHRFLFTGDMQLQGERNLLSLNPDLRADVLKVAHHGGATSTGYVFLRAVNPRYSVISCGANNDYGHPHEEALSRLNDIGSTIFRTDTLGTVVATSQGDSLTFNTTGIIPTQQYQDVEDGLSMITYIGNDKTKKYHLPTCSGLPKESNRVYFKTFGAAIAQDYTPCGTCKPPS